MYLWITNLTKQIWKSLKLVLKICITRTNQQNRITDLQIEIKALNDTITKGDRRGSLAGVKASVTCLLENILRKFRDIKIIDCGKRTVCVAKQSWYLKKMVPEWGFRVVAHDIYASMLNIWGSVIQLGIITTVWY